jgi:hypothetical protein
MHRDRRRDVRPGDLDELRRLARGDVLEHHLEPREALEHRTQRFLDERLLAVEHVDRRVGRFAVHQQRQAELLHLLQRMEAARQARHALVRMRRRARGIELDAVHVPRQFGACDLLRRRVVGQVERHQRIETGALRKRAEDAFAVIERLCRGAHRRLEVRHHDGARETPRRVRDHRGERCAVRSFRRSINLRF